MLFGKCCMLYWKSVVCNTQLYCWLGLRLVSPSGTQFVELIIRSWHRTMLSAWALPKTPLVLDSARQHTAISRFHVPRPTLVIVLSQLPGQHHGTDYSNNPVMWFTAEFQDSTQSSLFWWTVLSFPFSSNAGAVELDSMLRRLRNWRPSS